MSFSQEEDVLGLLRLKRGTFRAIIRQNYLKEIFTTRRQELLNSYSENLERIFTKLQTNELSSNAIQRYKCSVEDVQYIKKKIEEAYNLDGSELISLVLYLIGENDPNQLLPFINEKIDSSILKKYLQINQFGHHFFRLFTYLFKTQNFSTVDIIPQFLNQINQQVGIIDFQLFGDYCTLFYYLSLLKLVDIHEISILCRQSLKHILLNNASSEIYKYVIASISEVYDIDKREITSDSIIVQFVNHLAFEVLDQKTSELAMNVLGRFLSGDDYQTYNILYIVERNSNSLENIFYLDQRLLSLLQFSNYSIQYKQQALLVLSNLIASEIDILQNIHQRGNLIKLIFLLEKEYNSELRLQYLFCLRNAVSVCDKIILIDLLQNNMVLVLSEIAKLFIYEEFELVLQILEGLYFQSQIDTDLKVFIDAQMEQAQIHEFVDKFYNETKNENIKNQCQGFFQQQN